MKTSKEMQLKILDKMRENEKLWLDGNIAIMGKLRSRK